MTISRYKWLKSSGGVRWGVLLAVVFLLLMPAGCGGYDGTVSSPRHRANSNQGSLKPVHWGIVRLARQSVLIGAFVPYCPGTQAEPYIEQVEQRRRSGRVILTMLVRFPPRNVKVNKEGCLGEGTSVSRWVNLGRDTRNLQFFDGKTAPPEEVQARH